MLADENPRHFYFSASLEVPYRVNAVYKSSLFLTVLFKVTKLLFNVIYIYTIATPNKFSFTIALLPKKYMAHGKTLSSPE